MTCRDQKLPKIPNLWRGKWQMTSEKQTGWSVTSRNFCMMSTALHCLKALRADSALLTTLCSTLSCVSTKLILTFSSLLFSDSRDSVSQLRLSSISVCRPTLTICWQNSVLLYLTLPNNCNQHMHTIELIIIIRTLTHIHTLNRL